MQPTATRSYNQNNQNNQNNKNGAILRSPPSPLHGDSEYPFDPLSNTVVDLEVHEVSFAWYPKNGSRQFHIVQENDFPEDMRGSIETEKIDAVISHNIPSPSELEFTDSPWDGSKSRFTIEELLRSVPKSMAHWAEHVPGKDGQVVKGDLHLAFKEPDGTVNINGVRAALEDLNGLGEEIDKHTKTRTKIELEGILSQYERTQPNRKKPNVLQSKSQGERSDEGNEEKKAATEEKRNGNDKKEKGKVENEDDAILHEIPQGKIAALKSIFHSTLTNFFAKKEDSTQQEEHQQSNQEDIEDRKMAEKEKDPKDITKIQQEKKDGDGKEGKEGKDDSAISISQEEYTRLKADLEQEKRERLALTARVRLDDEIKSLRRVTANLPGTPREWAQALINMEDGTSTKEDAAFLRKSMATMSKLLERNITMEELGVSGKKGVPAANAKGQLLSLAKVAQEKDPKMTMDVAIAKVAEGNPKLYTQYLAEQRRAAAKMDANVDYTVDEDGDSEGEGDSSEE
jgi:hypothetical protein